MSGIRQRKVGSETSLQSVRLVGYSGDCQWTALYFRVGPFKPFLVGIICDKRILCQMGSKIDTNDPTNLNEEQFIGLNYRN